jgi:hypothetical protein
MPSRGPTSEAVPGSLPPQVLRDLVLLRDFFEARDKAMQSLFGVTLRRSHLRDALIRGVLIEFGYGRLRHVSFYQAQCAALAGRSSVQEEIRNLVGLRVLLTRPDPENVSALLVAPTTSLVTFYSERMTSLAEEVDKIFVARRDVS